MRKLISLFILGSSSLFADYYGSVGVGPYSFNPQIGLGYRQDQTDVNINFLYTENYQITNISFNRIYDVEYLDLYVGPSLGINYIDLRSSHIFDKSLGIILGREFHNEFMDLTIQKQLSSKSGIIRNFALRMRYGVYF